MPTDYDNGELPIERTVRALSCDGTGMNLPMVHTRAKTGSLASLDPLPPALVLTIEKSGLDGAHKDKNHKMFSPNFKVWMEFSAIFLFVLRSTDL